ncbi:MAG: hypothetical protein WBQ31_22640 [Candidatus Acidiferrales bacterium]
MSWQDGYNVVVTAKAQQALEILQHETPNVILAEAEGGTSVATIFARS